MLLLARSSDVALVSQNALALGLKKMDGYIWGGLINQYLHFTRGG
jgi:hypothetical protein